MTLKERIIRKKDGCFVFRDSFSEMNDESVGNVCSELVKESILIRLSQGVYYKPVRTRLGIVYPTIEETIRAIAKRDQAKIIPTGNTAMHQLGLTMQVPMNYEFLTNGAARTLNIDNREITLKHGVANNFAFRNALLSTIHQAMRAIGKDRVSEEQRGQLSKLLHGVEKNRVLIHDLKLLPAWELKIIKEIIGHE